MSLFIVKGTNSVKNIKISSVADFHKPMGIETLHPLISVVNFADFPDASALIGEYGIQYEVYAIFLKETKSCGLRYGHSVYDYEEGTIIFIAPGQKIELSNAPGTRPEGWALLFHPDLLHGTSLGKRIRNFCFFDYSVHEALHMSERERSIIVGCLKEISYELNHSIDKHSKSILVSNIEVLLSHSQRFYDRQFITREIPNHRFMAAFREILSGYWETDRPGFVGIPSVAYFADRLNLSPGYFGDLVKRETRKSAQEYIQLALIERAKELLDTTPLSISEVAYALGFTYPHHFTRLFNNKVGQSPKQYRMTR